MIPAATASGKLLAKLEITPATKAVSPIVRIMLSRPSTAHSLGLKANHKPSSAAVITNPTSIPVFSASYKINIVMVAAIRRRSKTNSYQGNFMMDQRLLYS